MPILRRGRSSGRRWRCASRSATAPGRRPPGTSWVYSDPARQGPGRPPDACSLLLDRSRDWPRRRGKRPQCRRASRSGSKLHARPAFGRAATRGRELRQRSGSAAAQRSFRLTLDGVTAMVAISKQYAREMNEKFGYFATWLPNVRLKLGDIGIIREQVFEPVSSLEQLGIAFAIDRDRQAADLDYTSSDAVSIEAKASATAHDPAATPATADGSISISFSRAEAVVFQASGCVTSRIADVKSLGEEILSRYHRDAWDPDHVVVTDLITAAGGTILISNGQNAHIDLA